MATTFTAPHALVRQLAIGLLCSLALSPALAKLDAENHPGALIELPEITTALDREFQVSLQVVLRLSGSITEKRARSNLIRLRHALVMELADHRPGDLSAVGIESLIEDFRGEANALLGAPNGIRSVLVKKFVVQSK